VANLLTKILRMGEGRKVKVLQQRVGAVTALEPEVEKLSDDELRAKTDEFRGRLAEARPSTASCPRPSPSCARPPGAP
jgi:preprotein translocase subunit SecA